MNEKLIDNDTASVAALKTLAFEVESVKISDAEVRKGRRKVSRSDFNFFATLCFFA